MNLVSLELAKLYLHRIFFVRKLRIAALAFILKSGIPLTGPDISRGSFYAHALEFSKLEFDFNIKESIDGFKTYKENIHAASVAVVDFRRLKTH